VNSPRTVSSLGGHLGVVSPAAFASSITSTAKDRNQLFAWVVAPIVSDCAGTTPPVALLRSRLNTRDSYAVVPWPAAWLTRTAYLLGSVSSISTTLRAARSSSVAGTASGVSRPALARRLATAGLSLPTSEVAGRSGGMGGGLQT